MSYTVILMCFQTFSCVNLCLKLCANWEDVGRRGYLALGSAPLASKNFTIWRSSSERQAKWSGVRHMKSVTWTEQSFAFTRSSTHPPLPCLVKKAKNTLVLTRSCTCTRSWKAKIPWTMDAGLGAWCQYPNWSDPKEIEPTPPRETEQILERQRERKTLKNKDRARRNTSRSKGHMEPRKGSSKTKKNMPNYLFPNRNRKACLDCDREHQFWDKERIAYTTFETFPLK